MATGRRRGRGIILVLVILILLLVAAYAVLQFGGGVLGIGSAPTASEDDPAVTAPVNTPTPEPASIEIVVTSNDVRRGHEITEDRIMLVSIPSIDYVEGEYFTSKEEVLGSRALKDMSPRTPLTPDLIIPPGSDKAAPSFEIPRGMVAISLPVNRLSSVAYGIQKGDHVNLIASLLMVDVDPGFQSELPNRTGILIGPGPQYQLTDVATSLTSQILMSPEYTNQSPTASSMMGRVELEPTSNNPVWVVPSEPQRPRLVSQTLIQDVMVLQLGDFDTASDKGEDLLTAPDAAGGDQVVAAEATGEEAAPAAKKGPDVVTLVVSPQDAVTLNYLMLAGANFNMVLRSAGDEHRVDTEAVTLQFVLDQYRIPNPAKLPYGTAPRVDQFPDYVPSFPEPGKPTPVPTGN